MRDITDVPEDQVQEMAQFFAEYKLADSTRWSRVDRWWAPPRRWRCWRGSAEIPTWLWPVTRQMEIVLAQRYRLGREIGSGSFGQILEGVDTRTDDEVAIKMEEIRTKHPQLRYEARVYEQLRGGAGFPHLRWSGIEGDYNILVMDRLGPNLETLFNRCRRRFDLKTVCMLADQMISRLQHLHAARFLHRDIKPDNFLVGRGPFSSVVYLIDMGLSKRFRRSGGTHIPLIEGKNLTGTARYASLYTHQGLEQSRRDDMEALGYVLIYFLRGKLPWQGLRDSGDKYEKISQCKSETSLEQLCGELPHEVLQYMRHCRSLAFEEAPDYRHLRQLFRDTMRRHKFRHDYQYCWERPEAR